MSQSAWRLLMVTVVVSSAVAGGCSGPASEADHRLEHVIPDHKPETFSDAVAELAIRGRLLDQQPVADEDLAELSDIIDWLPELAADSDLRRQQWEQVQQTSRDLAGIVSQLGGATATSSDHETWVKSLAVLQKLVPDADSVSQRASRRTLLHHDHSHHNHGDAPANETETGR